MIHTYNDWFKWGYDENGKLWTKYDKHNGFQLLSFAEAIRYNAIKTIEDHPDETFDMMFSGGIDSEVLLRAYIDLGQPIRANIFRYEDNINEYDMSYAEQIVKELKIPYKIIDFNIVDFYKKGDALKVYEIAKTSHARALPNLKFMDYVDGLPIYATSDIRWYRPSTDYSSRCEWRMQDFEYEFAWSHYADKINRKALMQWFRYTPEMVSGWMQSAWFRQLVSDKFYGKLGIMSTKYLGYAEVYDNLRRREKKTGFEMIEDVIKEFQQSLPNTDGVYPYAQIVDRTMTEFYEEFAGSIYDTLP